MVTFTDASHNVLHTLGPAAWREDLAKSGQSDVCGYQEAGGDEARATIKEWCANNDRGLFQPDESSNPISWKKRIWEPWGPGDKPYQGHKMAHEGARAMGIDHPLADVNPARTFSYVGLWHKGAKKTVLRINVHAVAGATNPDSGDGPLLSQWKNWCLQQYYLELLAYTARQLAHCEGPQTIQRTWDLICVGGDYNADLLLQRGDEWYYPSRLMPTLYTKDRLPGGMDHLQHAHGSDCEVHRRWTVDGNTDHRMHFVSRNFRLVDDTPGG